MTVPPFLVDLAGRLLAEPQVLATWSRDTGHARLAMAYTALYGRVVQRVAALADALGRDWPDAKPALVEAAERHAAQAAEVRFELARLKWLLIGRRTRLATDGFAPYAPHRAAEHREVDELERLMADLHSVLC